MSVRMSMPPDLLKLDPSLRNLEDELLLDIILYGSDKYKDTVYKEILLYTIVLSKIPNSLKDHYLTTNLLSLLLFYFLGNLI